MALKTTRWDSADYLKTKEDIAGYLDAVLGNVARSKGMTEIAKDARLSRSSLYKALSSDGNPEFATVASVLKTMGLRLSVAQDDVKRRRAPRSPSAAAAARRRPPASVKSRKKA
jgi:probable addiction module antidote protein